MSLCRALGADIVIAVDLNSDLLGRRLRTRSTVKIEASEKTGGAPGTMLGRLHAGIGAWRSSIFSRSGMPSMIDVITSSINIMQVRITRSRLAGEPADIMITPRLSQMALMDFHRAARAIEEGRNAANAALPQLTQLLGKA